MRKFYYCDKCGDIVPSGCGIEMDKCWCCENTNYVEIPEKYGTLHWGINDWDNRDIIDEEVIKKSPNLDLYYFENRHEIVKQKNDRSNYAYEHGKAILKEQSRVAHCPSCGSTNVSNIGTVGRMVSVGLFGLASSKIGKTHRCNNCGTMW